MATKRRTHRLDRAISGLAEGQHGIVSRRQLFQLGLSPADIHARVASGRLHRLHRGVYAVGHRLLRREGHWKAATLAIGDDAVLSHRCAAAHWNLLAYGGGRIEITVPRRVRPRQSISLHCRRSLPAHHTTTRQSIPVTTLARTLADLAAIVPPRLLERAFGQAEALKLFDRRAIEEIFRAESRRPGARNLRILLARRSRPSSLLSRSSLEERLLSLCDHAAIERPELNVPFTLPDGTEIVIDALWRGARLALEVDSETFHSSWSAQISDRRRDQQLTLAGLRPLRVTASEVTSEAKATARLLRGLGVARAPKGAAVP